jgi:hypothetical protein
LQRELLQSEDSFSEPEILAQKSILGRRERLGSLLLDCFKDDEPEEMMDNEEAFNSIEKSTPTFEHMSEASGKTFSSQKVE